MLGYFECRLASGTFISCVSVGISVYSLIRKQGVRAGKMSICELLQKTKADPAKTHSEEIIVWGPQIGGRGPPIEDHKCPPLEYKCQ